MRKYNGNAKSLISSKMKTSFMIEITLSKNGNIVEDGSDHCIAICDTLKEVMQEIDCYVYNEIDKYKKNKKIDAIDFRITELEVNKYDDEDMIFKHSINTTIDLDNIRNFEQKISDLEYDKQNAETKEEENKIDIAIEKIEKKIDEALKFRVIESNEILAKMLQSEIVSFINQEMYETHFICESDNTDRITEFKISEVIDNLINIKEDIECIQDDLVDSLIEFKNDYLNDNFKKIIEVNNGNAIIFYLDKTLEYINTLREFQKETGYIIFYEDEI